MLNLYNEISSYGPINLDSLETDNEKEIRAYELYNKALLDIKTGNEDIASIKLKKSISLKEDFYLSKLILGLYQAHKGNYKQAVGYFEDVVNHDSNYGVSALKYLRELNVSIEKNDSNLEDEDSYVIKYQKEKKDRTKAKHVAIGVIIGVLFMIPFLLISFNGNKQNTNNNEENTNNNNTENAVDVDEYVSKINELSKENENLKAKNEKLEGDIEKIQNNIEDENDEIEQENYTEFFIDYLNISNLSNENNYLEAANAMKQFMNDYEDIPLELEEYVNNLYSKTMDEAANYCEEEGVSLYQQKKHQESIDLLSKTDQYRPTYERMYRVIYYIARNQMAIEEYEIAIENFEEVTKIAPNQEWLNYANDRISEINEILEDTSSTQ